MTAPDLLPILSRGVHKTPKDGACLMEYASLLAGEDWSDHPPCIHPVLAEMARTVNDRLDDDQRQNLLPLVPRLIGTAGGDWVLSVRLAVWCARRVLHLTGDARPACEEAVRVTEAWCDGRRATARQCRATAAAVTATVTTFAANAAAYTATASAADAAIAAADAADTAATTYTATYTAAPTDAADAAAAAADAAIYTVPAAAAPTGGDLPGLLGGLLDTYDQLVGRTVPPPLADSDLRVLAEATR
ncbi:MAG: hypothetical protein ACRDMV_25240 [Streptosporangiales bacterium]